MDSLFFVQNPKFFHSAAIPSGKFAKSAQTQTISLKIESLTFIMRISMILLIHFKDIIQGPGIHKFLGSYVIETSFKVNLVFRIGTSNLKSLTWLQQGKEILL